MRTISSFTVFVVVLLPKVFATIMPDPPRIAVIGGGAAGLASARVLSRNGGLEPKVLEKDPNIGGVWRHVKNSKTKPMYRGLRTNLPREIMNYREKRWGNKDNSSHSSYATHEDVLKYLEEYCNDFDLLRFITFDAKVEQLTILTDEKSRVSPQSEVWPQIQLEWSDEGDNDNKDRNMEVFDAVLVCNGHYAKASVPHLPGLEQFRGRIMHSLEYDDPTEFRGERVLCVGARASGADLAREISEYADKVYLSDSCCPPSSDGKSRQSGNVCWVPTTAAVETDGSIRFDGEGSPTPQVDTIIFCTGYDYSFPFINEKSNLDFDCIPGERRVMPLYEHFWHARFPNLAFVGLPHSILPFPMFELQAEAALAQWMQHNPSLFPALEDRLEEASNDAVSGGGKPNGRISDTHYMGTTQWDYWRKLAKIAGVYNDNMEAFICTTKEIWDHSGSERKGGFPGDDAYRSTVYSRNAAEESFQVVYSKLESESTARV